MRWWVVGGGGGHCRDCDGALVLAAKMAGGLLRLEIPDAKARADVEDNFRKTIGQLLGGAVVLVGGRICLLSGATDAASIP